MAKVLQFFSVREKALVNKKKLEISDEAFLNIMYKL